MHTSSVVCLLSALVAQPPTSFQEYAKTAMTYYTAPDPAFGPRLLKELLRKENLELPFFANNDHLLNIHAQLLGDIAAGKPKIVREYEDLFGKTPAAGQRLIVRALRICGDGETKAKIDEWIKQATDAGIRSELSEMKKHLDDPKRKHIRETPAREPKDLDLLWANFFITGEFAPIGRLLDVFDQPDTQQNATLKRVAKWSLSSNLQQHAKLGDLVRRHADERKGGSRKIVDELAPPMLDAKTQAAIKAVVVGKWLSDDNEKIPLEFLADGSASVAFFKENGAWVLARGTFTIVNKETIRSQASYQGSTLTQSWQVKDGTLLGSHGPRREVRWVKSK